MYTVLTDLVIDLATEPCAPNNFDTYAVSYPGDRMSKNVEDIPSLALTILLDEHMSQEQKQYFVQRAFVLCVHTFAADAEQCMETWLNDAKAVRAFCFPTPYVCMLGNNFGTDVLASHHYSIVHRLTVKLQLPCHYEGNNRLLRTCMSSSWMSKCRLM